MIKARCFNEALGNIQEWQAFRARRGLQQAVQILMN